MVYVYAFFFHINFCIYIYILVQCHVSFTLSLSLPPLPTLYSLSVSVSLMQSDTESSDVGVLVKCFQVQGIGSKGEMHDTTLHYQTAVSYDGCWTCHPKINEYDCPILSLSDLLYTLKSTCILKAVSVMHECTSNCVIEKSSYDRAVEHESVSYSQLVLKHDWSYKFFSLNVYCMNN